MAARTVIANITLTLDGRTTGPGGPFDMSCIAPYGVTDDARNALIAMTSATTVLLGRKNFEGFSSWWPNVAADPSADPRDRIFAQWLNGVDKVVFSSAPLQSQWSHSSLADLGPVQTVQQLRDSDGGDIRVLSSQSVIRQLLGADEVDRFEVTLAPEILGSGERLFGDVTSPARWALARVTPNPSGAVLLTYDRSSGQGGHR